MRTLILAEKPAVARDLARVLQVPPTGGGNGAFFGDRHVITWCIGHLVELEEPGAYQAAWKRWSFAGLPMLPDEFRLRPSKTTLKQWRVVRDLLRSREFDRVINACDAGREGELIFRYCYELAGSRLPIERLWISSLTDQSISQGLAKLRRGQDYAGLFDAARCRAEADWLVGMNATRAVTLQRRQTQDVLCSIGRVQTPTLGLIVGRERQILSFVPREYWEVHGDMRAPADRGGSSPGTGPGGDDRAGSAADPGDGTFRAFYRYAGTRRLGQEAFAREVCARSAAAARRDEGPLVESVDARTVREPPPLLFDLTSLQRTANRRYGLSAHQTLQVAQALYEKHKLISYPRTDSRYLTSDLVPGLPKLFGAVGQAPAYARFCTQLLGQPATVPRRVFRDDRAHDHHAIIPTGVALSPAKLSGLSREEGQLLDLIVRRFLGAFFPDAEFRQTVVVIRAGLPAEAGKPPAPKKADDILETLPPPPDRYEARGRVRVQAGWQEVAGYGSAPGGRGDRADNKADDKADDKDQPEADASKDDEQALPDLRVGQRLSGAFHPVRRQTQPPPRFTEGTLLSAMEFAGQHLEDEELRQRMKDVGLGTPATRAAIIETLILRTYIERRGKQLHPTALGMDLVQNLPVPGLASPELTGQWEARLSRIARGEEQRAAFMADIARYVTEIVSTVQRTPAPAAVPLSGGGPSPSGRGSWSRAGRGAAGPQGTRRPRRTQAGKRAPAGKRTASHAASSQYTDSTDEPSVASAPFAGPPSASAPFAGPPSASAPFAEAWPAAKPRRRTPAASTGTAGTTGTAAPRRRAAKGPAGTSRSSLAAEVGAAGTAVEPALSCPRCGQGHLLVGRRGWGCSRWQAGCPLVVPFEMFGRRLSPADLRQLVGTGASAVMDFRPGAAPIRARLRLAPQGSPAGFVYLEPLGAG